MEPAMSQAARVWRWQQDTGARREADELAVEEPLEIRVDTRPVVVTMRTPGHDADLAAGFLVTEGILHRRRDLLRMSPHVRNDAGNVLEVFLTAGVRVDFAQLTRHVYASSSCGLCGKASITAVHRRFPKLRTSFRLEAKVLSRLPDRLRQHQATFARTGGLHAAALFDSRGKLIALREDVGRHNAVDKVLGHAFLRRRWPPERCVLMVSGRASFEIVQKALAARVPVVAAVSAPSSLAVEFTRRSGQALVGFLREDRMNVYSHPERIVFG